MSTMTVLGVEKLIQKLHDDRRALLERQRVKGACRRNITEREAYWQRMGLRP